MERRLKPTCADSTASGFVEFMQRSRTCSIRAHIARKFKYCIWKPRCFSSSFGKASTFISYLGRCYILQTESPRSLPRQDFSVSSTFAIREILSNAQLTAAGSVGHLQPAGYTTHITVCGRRVWKCEWISVPFIQIASSVVLFLCAQSYHMVGSRASGEARSRSPLRCPMDRHLFLLTNEKYLPSKWLVNHVRRGLFSNPAQMEITNSRQLVDAWRSGERACVSSLPVFLKVNLDSQRCRMCFVSTWSTTSDHKCNQAAMTHSRHKGSSWISWRIYANENGDDVSVSCQPECIKPCLSFTACKSTNKLQKATSGKIILLQSTAGYAEPQK